MSVADLMDSSAWDQRHASTEHPWCCAPASALTSRIAALTPRRAIDLACGAGRHARALAEMGWEVEGVDFSPVAVEIANAAPDGHHVSYTVGDVRTWRPAEAADLIVIGFLHLPIDELIGVISAAGTWLAPGGRLLYLGHARENSTRGIGGPSDPRVLPGIDDLAWAAHGMRVHELAHLQRPHGDDQAIDVLLHAEPWQAHYREPTAIDTPVRG